MINNKITTTCLLNCIFSGNIHFRCYVCCNHNMKEVIVIIRTFLFLLGISCAALACHLVCLGFELFTPSQHSSQSDLHQFV